MPIGCGVSKGDVVYVMCVTRDGTTYSENFKVTEVISTSTWDFILYLEGRALREDSPVSIRSITIRQVTPVALRF